MKIININTYIPKLRKSILKYVSTESTNHYTLINAISHYNGRPVGRANKFQAYTTKEDVVYATYLYLYNIMNKPNIINGINNFLLKILPQANTIYKVNNKEIDGKVTNRINQIFSNIKQLSQILWPYIFLNEWIEKNICFITSEKELLELLKLPEVITSLKNNFLQILAPEILADHTINNNLSIDEAINDLKLDSKLEQIINSAINQNSIFNGFNINNKISICLQMSNSSIKQICKYIKKNKDFKFLSFNNIKNNNDLTEKVYAMQADKYEISYLQIGQSIPFDGKYFWWNLSHDISYTPVIYINGNVISSKDGEVSKEWGHGRVHHRELFTLYFQNMELHKNDIIKQSEEEWKKCDGFDWDTIRKYNGVRGVIKNNICTLIDAATPQGKVSTGLETIAAQAINQEKQCQVLVISDDMTSISREARLIKNIRLGKRLLRKK